MRAGFNGARLHQKVFEERFLYHADCMGYLVWGEYGDWGYIHSGVRVANHIDDTESRQVPLHLVPRHKHLAPQRRMASSPSRRRRTS